MDSSTSMAILDSMVYMQNKVDVIVWFMFVSVALILAYGIYSFIMRTINKYVKLPL